LSRYGRAVAAGLLIGAVAPAWSSHVGEDLTLDQQAVASTNQLIGALRQYDAAPAGQRAAALARLTDLVAQRRAHMLALLQRNPSLAAVRVLPVGLRNKLPAEVQAQIERDVALSGTINARIQDDFPGGRSSRHFELVDAAGQRLDLSVADADEREMLAMVGRRARVAAVQIDRHLLVQDKRHVELEAAGGSTSTGGTTVVAATLVQGAQNTLSILVNFSDSAMTCNATDVANRLFGATGATVNNNYRESSGGLVSFSGQAVGPFTINYSASGSCDYQGWASAAEAAARAAGIDTTKYSRVNYVTPRNSTCGWSGLAYMPGRQSWVQSCGSTGVFSHELGHNLSFHHAATPSSEYGDGSDPMGGARVVNLNAANRVMAGWTAGSAVLDVMTGGSYALSSVSAQTATASPKVLRLAKPDTNERYYISLREAIGLDTGLAAGFIDTISVHRSTGTLPSKTYLLQNLAVGQTFTDSVNGITIANQAVSNGTATVSVTLGAGACVRNAPAVSAAPTSRTGAAGAALAYSVTVTNKNSAACGTSSFALSQALPAGFTGTLGATSLAIAAGSTVSTNWTVSSSTAVADATYTLTASAADSSTGVNVAAHASAVVYTPAADTTPPALTIVNPSAGARLSGNKANITATATDASGVAAVEFYVDGVLLARDTGTPYSANWNLRKAGAGTHTIRVRAIDTRGNASEQTITVTH
jgi:hypothetical protein